MEEKVQNWGAWFLLSEMFLSSSVTLDQLCNPSELQLHYLQNKHAGLDLHGSPFHSKIFMLLFEKKNADMSK